MNNSPDVVVLFPFGIHDGLLVEEIFKHPKPRVIFATSNFEHLLRCLDGPLEIFIAEEKESKSTLGFIRKLAELTKERKWENVLIIAAPPHLYRAVRDARKVLGKKVLVKGVKPSFKCRWFENRKKAIIWWIREIILRAVPFGFYQKVAA